MADIKNMGNLLSSPISQAHFDPSLQMPVLPASYCCRSHSVPSARKSGARGSVLLSTQQFLSDTRFASHFSSALAWVLMPCREYLFCHGSPPHPPSPLLEPFGTDVPGTVAFSHRHHPCSPHCQHQDTCT